MTLLAGKQDADAPRHHDDAAHPLAFPARILGLAGAGALAIVGLVFGLLAFTA